MDFRLTRELGEKMAEKWEKSPKNGSKIGFLGHFCHFSAFFLPSSPVRPEAIFRPLLPDFGPKARRQSLAGQWGRNTGDNFGVSMGGSQNFPGASGPGKFWKVPGLPRIPRTSLPEGPAIKKIQSRSKMFRRPMLGSSV